MGHKYLLVRPDVGLFFPAVDFLANKITDIADDRAGPNVPVVVDCHRFRGIDYTAVKVIFQVAVVHVLLQKIRSLCNSMRRRVWKS